MITARAVVDHVEDDRQFESLTTWMAKVKAYDKDSETHRKRCRQPCPLRHAATAAL